MDEHKVAKFWGMEKELRKLLVPIGAQLELTHQVLSAQLPKVQELFEELTQLGQELDFQVDRGILKPIYDYLEGNRPFHPNNPLQKNAEAEKEQQELL